VEKGVVKMKISSTKQQLELGTQTVSKAVSSKNTIPALSGIYLRAIGDKLILKATDLEIGIESVVDAQTAKEGEVVIPARYFTEIVKKLPEEQVEIVVDDNNLIRISSGKSLFQIHGFSPQEFPALPEPVEQNGDWIDREIMKTIVRQTIFATANSESRPVLTGVLYKREGRNLITVATDGHRLAYKTAEINNDNQFSIILPAKSLQELNRLLNVSEEEVVGVVVEKSQVFFDLGKIKMSSRLIEGQFPNYRGVIPQNWSIKIKTGTKLFQEAVERCSLLGKDNTNFIKINLEGSRLKISSDSPEIGQVYEEIDVETEGDKIEIAFNSRYLLDGLKGIEDDEIYMEMNSSLSPAVLKPVNYDNYLYVVMPIRLN
jgi:DNA polymerase-3 subunit beta